MFSLFCSNNVQNLILKFQFQVEEKLIHRKPELHDVLHDGLVLTRKNRNRSRRKNQRTIRSHSEERAISSAKNSPRTAPDSSAENLVGANSSALFYTVKPARTKSLDRLDRTLSPHPHILGRSLNKNLKIENARRPHSSNSRSRSNSRNTDRTYDVLSDSEKNNSSSNLNETRKFETTLGLSFI